MMTSIFYLIFRMIEVQELRCWLFRCYGLHTDFFKSMNGIGYEVKLPRYRYYCVTERMVLATAHMTPAI